MRTFGRHRNKSEFNQLQPTLQANVEKKKKSFCVGQHIITFHRLKIGRVRKATLKLRVQIFRI